VLTLTILYTVKPFNLLFINQVITINKKVMLMKLTMFITFLSKRGLPPFLGFLPK
jgi:NADH:ubiquinone oxidoreductase subunit 2 (subunit N)